MGLKKNIGWSLFGSSIFALSKWFVLIVIAKNLTVEDVGIFTLSLAIVSPIFMLTNLQLRSVQATDVSTIYPFESYATTRLVSFVFSIIIIVIILFITSYEGLVKYTIVSFFILKLVESLSDLLYGQIQKNEKLDVIGISYAIRGSLFIIVMFVTTYYSMPLFYCILTVALSWIIIFLLYDVKMVKNNIGYKIDLSRINSISIKSLKKVVQTALPLAAAVFIASLITNVPRYYVDYYLDIEMLGYFGALTFIGVGADRVSAAVGHAIKPRLAKLYLNDRLSYNSLIIKMALLSLFGGGIVFLIFIMYGELILSVMYGEEYAIYNRELNWIGLAIMFQFVMSILISGVQASRKFQHKFWINMIVLLLIMIIGYPLVSVHGLMGACILIAIGALLSTLLYIIILIKLKNE